MACSECSGRRTSQVDDKVEYPWQTEAWMMENLFLKKRKHKWRRWRKYIYVVNMRYWQTGQAKTLSSIQSREWEDYSTLGDRRISSDVGRDGSNHLESVNVNEGNAIKSVTLPLCSNGSEGLWRSYIQLLS